MTKKTIIIHRRSAPLPLRDTGRAMYHLNSPWHQFLPLSDGKWRPNADRVPSKINAALAGQHLLYNSLTAIWTATGWPRPRTLRRLRWSLARCGLPGRRCFS